MKRVVIAKFLFAASMLLGAMLPAYLPTAQGAAVDCKDVKDAQCTSSSYCRQKYGGSSWCDTTLCRCTILFGN